jgi:hypothetical protein
MNQIVKYKKLKISNIPALVFCSLLLVFSCTKEERATKRDYPRVATKQVTNICASGVTFNASFLQAGSSEIIDHGFLFDIDPAQDIRYSVKISLGVSNGKGSFTATSNFGFTARKTYYVTAYVQIKDRVFYGVPVSFVYTGNNNQQ